MNLLKKGQCKVCIKSNPDNEKDFGISTLSSNNPIVRSAVLRVLQCGMIYTYKASGFNHIQIAKALDISINRVEDVLIGNDYEDIRCRIRRIMDKGE